MRVRASNSFVLADTGGSVHNRERFSRDLVAITGSFVDLVSPRPRRAHHAAANTGRGSGSTRVIISHFLRDNVSKILDYIGSR